VQANGSAPRPTPLRPADVRNLPGPRRVDAVRKALRAGEIDPTAVARDLDDWIALYRRDVQGPLRVLLIEALEPIDDPRVTDLLEDALDDRADGVRLEALRLLLDRDPERTRELTTAHVEDEGLEVRLLAAERLHAIDPERAVQAMLDTVRREAHGFREAHALDRVVEFLVDDVGDPAVVPALRELHGEVEDTEDMIEWAIETLQDTSR